MHGNHVAMQRKHVSLWRMENVIYNTVDVRGIQFTNLIWGTKALSVVTQSDARREHWVTPAPRDTDVSSDPGKQSGKTPKYQPRGSLGSKRNSTERRGSEKQGYPSAAAKRRQCQHCLDLAAVTTSSHPQAASSCPALYPCFILQPASNTGSSP